jgi:hypothetical protein
MIEFVRTVMEFSFTALGLNMHFTRREGWVLIVKAFSKCDNVVYVSEQ